MGVFQIDRRSVANFDLVLVLMVAMLGAAGVVNLTSAAAGASLWKVQTYWLAIGLVVCFFALVIDFKKYEKAAPLLYLFSLALLVGVHFLGRRVSGALSWYHLGPANFQPSELMKIALILSLARIYQHDSHEKPWGLRELLLPGAVIAVPVLSILAEPDAGTALIILLVCGSMIFFAGIRRWMLVIVVVAGLISFYPVWNYGLKPHQRSRILTFIHPEADPLGAGYNALQSKIAVGSGGVSGKGYKDGSQNLLRFLPEQQTDFVFSVWAEEWGFVWVAGALVLYLGVVWRGLRAAREAKDRFGMMLAFGCSMLIFWHVFVNIAMVVGLFPVIGVPLPFMSYGGSNLMTFMICVGLILNVGMRRYFF